MVKPGYKQTEVGVLPEDWAIKKLINLSDGGMQNGTFYEGSRKGTGVYFLNVGNLYQAAPIIPQTLGKFDASKDEIDRFRVKNGDLFFTRSSIVPSGIAYCNWYKDSGDNTTVFDSHVVRFKTDTDQVNPMYLYLQCVSQESRKYFISNAKVATMTTIDQAQIGNCLIPVPSLTEQKNIAEAISDADRIIRLLEKLIIKKKAIKQGAMQELLTGKRRLPGFSEKWEEKPISFFGNFVSGNCFPIKYQGCPSGELPFYKVSDFNNAGNSRVMDKANNYIPHNVASVLSCKIIPKNSVVFAKIGAAISLERKRITGCDCCIDNNMMSFLPYQKNIATYMCYLLQTIRFGEFVEATALPSLSGKTIGEIQRTFPPTIEEQIAIATVLSDLDSEIEALEQKLTKYRQVRQGMMQQLLTGKIRLM